MPSRPGRVCATCRQVVPTGQRCPRCYVYTPWARVSNGYPSGSTRRWRRIRAAHLRELPFCAWCGAPADEVDHIMPLSLDPARRYDTTNLQSLCRVHHRAKTAAESKAARRRKREAQDGLRTPDGAGHARL